MWPLWRDQLERRAPTAISIAASVVVVFGVIVPGLAGRGDGDSLVGLRMGFYWSLFWFGYVGLMFQMLDRRGLRVMRALPMPSRRLARAWWLSGATWPLLMGGLAYAAVVAVDALTGRVLGSRPFPGALIAPGGSAIVAWHGRDGGPRWSR